MSNGSRYANWLKREAFIIQKIDERASQEAARRGSLRRGIIRLSSGVVKRQASPVRQDG